jgi:hypothetical protein
MRVYDFQQNTSYDEASDVGDPTRLTFPLQHILGPNHLEAGYKPYPYARLVAIVAAPAIIQTAAVGANPWDHQYGPVGAPFALPMAALRLPPQIGQDGF